MNEVNDSRDDKVEDLERLEVFLIASFDSTSRVVEDRLDRDRSSLVLDEEWSRSFTDEAVDESMPTTDELLDRNESSWDSLEDKEGSSKVVNSFFKTKDRLLWMRVEQTNEFFEATKLG